ncbi:MAG: hypothetical protein ACI8WB_002047 [Phenylobacterium sp.]|jgi:hypothetical protein
MLNVDSNADTDNKLCNIQLSHIEALAQQRQSTVLVLGASNIDIDMLPALYDTLRLNGHCKQLDVVLYGRGGIVNAARRIALLLHQFCDKLCFMVPHYCESAATLLALSGHEIIAGPLAIFSPIDPQLQSAGNGTDAPSSLSSQDVRLFGQMMKDWFSVDDDEAQAQSASLLCNSIFPTTLTSFYRSTLELQQIGKQLLSYNLPQSDDAGVSKIIDQLIYGYHSHSYAITREELMALGINITADVQSETLAWHIAADIRANLGRGACKTVDDGWHDVIIATAHSIRLRSCKPDSPAPYWQIQQEVVSQ